MRDFHARAILVIALVSLLIGQSALNAAGRSDVNRQISDWVNRTGILVGCSVMLTSLAYMANRFDTQSRALSDAQDQIAELREEIKTQAEKIELNLDASIVRENESEGLIRFLDLSIERFVEVSSELEGVSDLTALEVTEDNVRVISKFCSIYDDLRAAVRKENSLELELAGPLRRAAIVKSASAKTLVDLNAERFFVLKPKLDQWKKLNLLATQVQSLLERLALVKTTVVELEIRVTELEKNQPESLEAKEARQALDDAKKLQREIQAELEGLSGPR